jgi:hypothetical protein
MSIPMMSTGWAARLWIAVVVLAYAAWSAFWVGVCAFPVAEECISATLILYVTGFPLALLTFPMGSTIPHVVLAGGLGCLQWGILAAVLIRKRSARRAPVVQ